MRPFIVNDEVRAELARIKAFAEANPFTLTHLEQMATKKVPSVGDNPGYSTVLPFDFRVVLSLEQQSPPLGWVWHLSVSVLEKGRLPHPATVSLILDELGFPPLEMCHVWQEELKNIGGIAINLFATQTRPTGAN